MSLRIAFALRTGAPMCVEHRCICERTVDTLGHHGLCCVKSKGRPRHSALNDVIQRALGSAKVPSVLEPAGLGRTDAIRPDGMMFYAWKNCKRLAWDVTVSDTFAETYIWRTSAGKAAEQNEARKVNTYAELEDRFYFQPAAFETMGVWGPSTTEFLKDLSQRIAHQTGEPRAGEYLRQRISIEIQRGNAISVLGTAESRKNVDELFTLLKF